MGQEKIALVFSSQFSTVKRTELMFFFSLSVHMIFVLFSVLEKHQVFAIYLQMKQKFVQPHLRLALAIDQKKDFATDQQKVNNVQEDQSIIFNRFLLWWQEF